MANGDTAVKVSAEVRAQFDGMRYADIPDEAPISGGSGSPPQGARSTDRVRRAAERARLASRDVFQDPPTRPKSTRVQAAAPSVPAPAPVSAAASEDVRELESQVRELKNLVEKFQKMPQVPMTMHPGAEQGLSFEVSPAYQKLTQQGINPNAVSKLLKRAQSEMDIESLKRPPMIEAWVVGQLLNTIDVTPDPMMGRYHVFMGTTGQGKTSSLVKFASKLVMQQKRKIAIVSLDTFKVGAADQLRIYAQILNVPFAVVRNPAEWAMAEEKLKGVQYILVDCPGFSLRTMDEADWLKAMLPPASMNRRVHYVQSALARDEDAMDLAQRYQMIGFDDVVFTRLDESSRHGLILNFQERFRAPLHSFGTGPGIPEDYELASKERVVDFLFKLSKVAK